MSCGWWSKILSYAGKRLGSRFDFIEHRLHLAQGMLVARAARTGDAFGEPGAGFIFTACFGQRLRCHEVARGVIGVICHELMEFAERGFGVALAGVLHGKAVAGKGIGWVLCKYLGERGDFVHSW